MNENDQKIYNTDDSWGNKVEEEEKEDRKTYITLDISFYIPTIQNESVWSHVDRRHWKCY